MTPPRKRIVEPRRRNAKDTTPSTRSSDSPTARMAPTTIHRPPRASKRGPALHGVLSQRVMLLHPKNQPGIPLSSSAITVDAIMRASTKSRREGMTGSQSPSVLTQVTRTRDVSNDTNGDDLPSISTGPVKQKDHPHVLPSPTLQEIAYPICLRGWTS